MNPSKNPDNNTIDPWHGYIKATLIISVLAFEALIICLLIIELNASSFRTTDRVLILLSLLFLPIIAGLLGQFFGKSQLINLKLPGNLEIQIKNLQEQVDNTERNMENKIIAKTRELEEQWEGNLSVAEQTLYPLIGGPNAYASDHLGKNILIIGSKNFSSNIVIAELTAQFLEMRGIRVQRRIPNGGTPTNYAFLIHGWIDMFIDYTGTGCLFLNVPFQDRSQDDILKDLNYYSKQRFHSEWLIPFGTKTNYCLVISRQLAESKNILKLSDLSGIQRGHLHFSGYYEFMNRLDGLPGLKNYYNLRFKKETICSFDERYQLVNEGIADISVGHTTDPDIQKYDLIVLEDDQRFFPDYYETPLVRNEALTLIPELRTALTDLAKLQMTNHDITSLIQDYEENPLSLHNEVHAMLNRKQK